MFVEAEKQTQLNNSNQWVMCSVIRRAIDFPKVDTALCSYKIKEHLESI
jgi:hypothetical protein